MDFLHTYRRLQRHLKGFAVLFLPCLAAYYLAFLLRFDGHLNNFARHAFGATVIWVSLIKLITLALSLIHI